MLRMQQQEASATFERAEGRRLLIEQSLLGEKMTALFKQRNALVIPSPQGNWLVEGLPPQSLLGRFFTLGDEIVTLIAEKERFIEVIVDQRDVYLLSVGDKGKIRFAGVAPTIYHATVKMISPLAKLEGIEQSLVVRMEIDLIEGLASPPLGLSAEIIIFGQPTPLWRHFFHTIRKVLRADLWL